MERRQELRDSKHQASLISFVKGSPATAVVSLKMPQTCPKDARKDAKIDAQMI